MNVLRFIFSVVLVLGVSVTNAQITQLKGIGGFQVTAETQLDNDTNNSDRGGCAASTCASPIAFPALTTGVQTCVTECNTGASAGPDFPGNNCYDFPNPTVWYQITVPANAATLNITVNSAVITNPNFMVFGTADCSTYTLYNDNGECYNGAAGTTSGNMAVPAGSTLLVAVSGGNGQVGNFTLCITPQADASACNVNDNLVVTATSMGSPLAGPYLPGETVSFCYSINQYNQANCNWLSGIVPDFGDCWAPSSFTAQGQPVAITTALTQAGNFCAGNWGWWADGVVQYNSPSYNVGAGWFFTAPTSTGGSMPATPNGSWGDGNGMCGMVASMGDCNATGGGLTWQVCFNLTVRTDCENGVNCAVSMKTYADGEVGSWTNLGCGSDLPTFFNAAAICCQMVVNAGTNETICQTQSTALNGSVSNNEGPTTYTWTSNPVSAMAGISDPNILNPTFTPPPGVTGPILFTLTVEDDNCTIANQVTVTVTPLPTVDISYSFTPFCTTFITQSVVLTNGVGAYTGGTYSAAPVGLTINASTGAITPSTSTPGDYTVTYTIPASGGCPSVPVQTTVTVTAAPTATIDYSDPFCTSDVGAETVVINGTGAYLGGTYSSTAGLTIDGPTGDITPGTSTAGSYTVTYTIPASGGCTAVPVTTPVVITEQPTATISYNDPFCGNVATAQSVTLNGTGSYLGGTYSADPAGLTINASTGAVTPSTSTPNTYTVTYTIPAVGGCAATPVVTSVVINPIPSFTAAGTDPTVCNGTDGFITIQGLDPLTDYTLTYNDDAVPQGPFNETSDAAGEITISGLNAGSYDNITISFVTTGCGFTSPITINLLNPGAPVLDDPADVVLCAPDSYILPVITGSNLSGDEAYFTGANGTGTEYNAGEIISTSMLLYVYDVSGVCSDQRNFTITITTPPTAAFSYAEPFCENTAGSFAPSLNGTGAFSGGDYSSTVGLTINTSTGNITPSTSTVNTYVVTYTIPASAGCPSEDVTTNVTITELPTGMLSYAGPFCSTEGVQAPTLSGTANYTGGTYTAGAGLSIDATTGEIDPSASTPNVYTVTYTIPASGGCSSVPVQASVTITAGPTATISYNDPFCDNLGGAQTVTLNGTGSYLGGTFSSTPAGLTLDVNNGNINASTSTPNTYDVTYTIPASAGCSDSDVLTTVTINPTPSFTLSGTDPTVCNGTDGSIVISGLGSSENYNVTYSQDGAPQGPNGEISDASGDILISGLPAGSYSNFTVDFNGCVGANAGPVTLINPGAPNIIPMSNVTFCDQYVLPGISGSNLTGNEAFYSGSGGTGTQYNTGDIITSSMTIYAYDINGACSDEESFTITINNTPAIDNPGNQSACDSFDLPVITGTNLSGSEAYQTAGGNPLTGPITSTQTVFIYDENGLCFDEQSFLVTISPSPAVTSFTGGGTYCTGDDVADVTLVVTGTPDFTVDYTFNGNPQTINSTSTSVNLGNATGVYVLTGLTDAGCTASISGTQTIVVNPVPAAPTAGDDATYCYYDGFTPMYAQTSEGGQLTWYSNAGLTTQVGTGTSLTPSSEVGTHVYYVTETAAGCQSESSTVTIVVENCLTEIPTAFTPDGDGVNDQWIIADLSTNFPNNTVKVFNRWGNLLFESEGYATPWDGTFNNDELPVGSYYFIVDFNDGGVTEPAAGTVTIIRN